LEGEYSQGVRYTKLKDKYQTWIMKAIVTLKEQDFSQKQIAEKLGMSEMSVSRLMRKSLKPIPIPIT